MIEQLAMTPVHMSVRTQEDEAAQIPQEPVKTFGEYLSDAWDETNRLQNESERLNKLLVAGDLDDISQAVVAGQKADIALQLTLQVRNRAVEAYQELMRMQI